MRHLRDIKRGVTDGRTDGRTDRQTLLQRCNDASNNETEGMDLGFKMEFWASGFVNPLQGQNSTMCSKASDANKTFHGTM